MGLGQAKPSVPSPPESQSGPRGQPYSCWIFGGFGILRWATGRLRVALLYISTKLRSVADILPNDDEDRFLQLHTSSSSSSSSPPPPLPPANNSSSSSNGGNNKGSTDSNNNGNNNNTNNISNAKNKAKPVKIFIDGVFDLTHFGHMNAFRQARAKGDLLVVGVNSDDSVFQCKGSRPVLTDTERYEAVKACRFVDEVLPATPYVMTPDYIEMLVNEYGIDYFVHGDDPCIVDGKDVYEAARKAGRFVTIPRTEGISTTDIVGRLLLCSKEHHKDIIPEDASPPLRPLTPKFASKQSQYLVTSQLIKAFTIELPKCDADDREAKVVYVDGAWDMFHAGHIALLKRASALGTRLVVGVHSDEEVNRNRGRNYPIMAMHERVLSVLGCRYVDDVLLNAPWVITEEMIATLNVSKVVRGVVRDCEEAIHPCDPHRVPKALGIHVDLDSENSLTLQAISARLIERRAEVEKRHAEKSAKETSWYREKHGLQTS